MAEIVKSFMKSTKKRPKAISVPSEKKEKIPEPKPEPKKERKPERKQPEKEESSEASESYDIDTVEFSIISAEEMLNYSVCQVENVKKNDKYEGTVYDKRMGTVNSSLCGTCNQDTQHCVGHFGHIKLNMKILHPLFLAKYIHKIMNCFCFHCSLLLLDQDQLELHGIMEYHGSERYLQILDLFSNITACSRCEKTVPQFSYADGKIIMCSKNKKDKNKTPVPVDEIDTMFKNIPDAEVELLGLNPKRFHPKNMIISVLPVLPIVDRPPIMVDGNLCDDDLTAIYNDIVKANQKIIDPKLPEDKRQLMYRTLAFRVKTLMDNTQGKAKCLNRRPRKCIKKRLSSKEGHFRSNLLGKRVNFAGRTVVGCDITLETDQVVVPQYMIKNITKPVVVNQINIKQLTQILQKGRVKFVERNGKKLNMEFATTKRGTQLLYGDLVKRKINGILTTLNPDRELLQPGDIIVRKNGEIVKDIELPKHREFRLQLGDIVHRHLQTNDWVLINRQPTLHKGSFLGFRIKEVSVGKTLRIPLPVTGSFNADFDGDEMNMHVPQTIEADTEVRNLMSVEANIISSQSSKPIIGLTQDSVLGAYLMTKGWIPIEPERFQNICMWMTKFDFQYVMNRMSEIQQVYSSYVSSTANPALKKLDLLFTGRGLMSMLLPRNFDYTKKNKAHPTEDVLCIRRGVVLSGCLDKNVLGTKTNSIIHALYQEYSSKTSMDYITHVQFCVNQWLIIRGYSIGIEDCMVMNKDAINEVISEAYIKASAIQDTLPEEFVEPQVHQTLNSAKNVGSRIAKESLAPDNKFKWIIASGAKGNYNNISQVTALLGQQDIAGQRAQFLAGEPRTLSCYPVDGIKDNPEREYESRGFIRHSFYEGLDPEEMWWHATSGREGITDTAVKTSDSGYGQRRLIKCLEDIKVTYDGTVRNSSGQIIQYVYGGDNMDGAKVVKTSQGYTPCYIPRIVDQLNNDYEIEHGIPLVFDQNTKFVDEDDLFAQIPSNEIDLDNDHMSDDEDEPGSPGSVGSFEGGDD